MFAIGAAQLIMNSSTLVTGIQCIECTQLHVWNEFVKVVCVYVVIEKWNFELSSGPVSVNIAFLLCE